MTQRSISFNAFMYLSVPVPAGATVTDLDACLRLFAEPEYLEESDRWYEGAGSWCGLHGARSIKPGPHSGDSGRRSPDRLCPQCKHYRRAAKRLEPYRLPQYLVIHLKRFYYKGPWREKIDRPVAFPTRYDNEEDAAQPEAGREAERRVCSRRLARDSPAAT